MSLGFVGGFLGPKLSWWWWISIIFIGATIFLPWKAIVFSQEDLLSDMRSLDQAIQEFSERRARLQELTQELDACGGLKQQQLDQIAARFEEIYTISPASLKALREILFSRYRRAILIPVFMLSVAALGGALLAFSFTKWLG